MAVTEKRKNKGTCMFVVGLGSLLTFCTGHECHRNLQPLWSADAGSSPVVSSPLIADVNGDNIEDVVATSFGGQVSVVDGTTGQDLTGWPLVLPKINFHAGPLLYDIDQDGIMEVLLTTTDARVSFAHANGTLFLGETLQISPLIMRRDWFRFDIQHLPNNSVASWSNPRLLAHFTPFSAFKRGSLQGGDLWSRYQPGVRPSGLSKDGALVYVDPHVLSTPVITDFDEDGSEDELVLSVNYYFEQKGQAAVTCVQMPCVELENYLASAVVVYSLKTRQVLFNTVLEVSKRTSQFPAYSLSSSSVAVGAEIVVATSAGSVYLVQNSHAEAQLLVSVDSVPGQVSVGDVNGDGIQEVLIIDQSGNVACKGLSGNLEWEARVSASAAAGIRITDIDGDGMLELVFATFDGYVWVLEANTGRTRQGWPVRVPGEVRAPVLITKILPERGNSPDIIVPVLEDKLAIIRSSDQCMEIISLGKMILAAMVTSDLLLWKPGLELVFGSDDGTIVCLGGKETIDASRKDYRNLMNAWPAEVLTCGGTTFYSGKIGVQLTERSQPSTEVSGRWQTIEFEIRDQRSQQLRGNEYHIKVSTGNRVTASKTYSKPGRYQEIIPALFRPYRALLTIRLTIPGGHCFQDSLHYRFNLHFPKLLPWLLAVPFLITMCLLLLLHGHDTSTGLLPTISDKLES